MKTSQVVLVVKNPPVNAGDIEMWIRSLGQKDPLGEGMTPTPVFLHGESLEQREPGRLQSIGLQKVAHD